MPDGQPPVTLPRRVSGARGRRRCSSAGAAVVRSTRGVTTAADSDLTNFFFRSADYILNGQPFQMYAVHASGGYPNYNPPLSIFLMAPLLSLARTFGFAANYGEQITFVALPFTLLRPHSSATSYCVVAAPVLPADALRPSASWPTRSSSSRR